MMGILEREEVMRVYEVSMPEEFGCVESPRRGGEEVQEDGVDEEIGTGEGGCPEDVFPAGKRPERCAQLREV